MRLRDCNSGFVVVGFRVALCATQLKPPRVFSHSVLAGQELTLASHSLMSGRIVVLMR